MIWCVEDDASIRDIEVYALQSTGFEAKGFEDGTSFWEALRTGRPELVVLDVMLPGIDGMELLRRMRADAALSDIPVVMATAKGAEYDKIRGLDLGADYYLTKPFGVMELEDGTSFWEALRTGRPELVVLDVMLPGIDGMELLRRMRADAALSDIPVVMATAKGAEYDKIRGLDLGADYYLTKPFGVMELVSCVKAVLRRCGTKTAAQLRCGGLVLDEESHTVTADGESVALTYKEFELLRLFLSHPGTAFSRDQLMADVWGTDYCGETRTVDMHIRTLRQKLGAYGEKIETVRGVGYRMEGKA